MYNFVYFIVVYDTIFDDDMLRGNTYEKTREIYSSVALG